MSEPTYTFEAHCTTCKAAYRVEVLTTQRKRVKAAGANREIWMQTHRDTTGHTRFWCDDSQRVYRIIGSSQGAQMVLADIEGYSTFRL